MGKLGDTAIGQPSRRTMLPPLPGREGSPDAPGTQPRNPTSTGLARSCRGRYPTANPACPVHEPIQDEPKYVNGHPHSQQPAEPSHPILCAPADSAATTGQPGRRQPRWARSPGPASPTKRQTTPEASSPHRNTVTNTKTPDHRYRQKRGSCFVGVDDVVWHGLVPPVASHKMPQKPRRTHDHPRRQHQPPTTAVHL